MSDPQCSVDQWKQHHVYVCIHYHVRMLFYLIQIDPIGMKELLIAHSAER